MNPERSDSSTSCHTPVLLQEVLELMNLAPGQIIVDGTLGGGGHAIEIAKRILPDGLVIGLDRDESAVQKIANRSDITNIRAIQASYADLPEVLAESGIPYISGLLLDLGLSSDQLADQDRGFSFRAEGELDMRFDPSRGEPAWRLLDRLSEKHLADLIYSYGEERFSRRIARAVVERRERQPIRLAADLAAIVKRAVPAMKVQRIHPATKTFQALRIAVNEELKALEIILRRASSVFLPGARFAVISYHSLEDRRVKNAFRESPVFEMITRKPVYASDEEVAANPRSRSAVLRVAEYGGSRNP